MQANAKAGLTFAAALRSILRSDPDIVLIGEIRDHETAQIAIEAALTGHLVLSTLHTNDAPSAITRLIEMGIEPFLVGSAARLRAGPAAGPTAVPQVPGGVPADPEALVPDRCPWPDEVSRADAVARPWAAGVLQDRLQGSARAARGHASVSEEIERLAVERASADAIGRIAQEEGMTMLRDDGLQKVLHGVTSIEEILRVVV